MQPVSSGHRGRLRKAGFKQKVTTRLAVGLAGPYWGTQDKHSLSAADFIPQTDAELDAFVQEMRANKVGNDQRPQPPNKIEDWEARVRGQNDVWALIYGAEWKPVRAHALNLLLERHQAEPHKWPLSIVSDIWEDPAAFEEGGKPRDDVASGHQVLRAPPQQQGPGMARAPEDLRLAQPRRMVRGGGAAQD